MPATLVYNHLYEAPLNGAMRPFFGFEYLFTDDTTPAGISDQLTDQPLSGALAECSVVFDATTPPNSLTVIIKDQFGIELATGTFAASGRLDLLAPIVFVPGQLSISISGNTTAGAVAKIILVVF